MTRDSNGEKISQSPESTDKHLWIELWKFQGLNKFDPDQTGDAPFIASPKKQAAGQSPKQAGNKTDRK